MTLTIGIKRARDILCYDAANWLQEGGGILCYDAVNWLQESSGHLIL